MKLFQTYYLRSWWVPALVTICAYMTARPLAVVLFDTYHEGWQVYMALLPLGVALPLQAWSVAELALHRHGAKTIVSATMLILMLSAGFFMLLAISYAQLIFKG